MKITTEGTVLTCDICGRTIPQGKGYKIIDGWVICGICEYYGKNSAGNNYNASDLINT